MNYIFDIDNTLADCSHRLHFIQKENKDWDSFHNACVDDKPINKVIEFSQNFDDRNKLFLTGRPESSKQETLKWLEGNKAICHACCYQDRIFMRKDGDHREDWVIKLERLNKLLESGKIQKDNTIIFDDRDQVVNALRENGWTCFQVKKGDY